MPVEDESELDGADYDDEAHSGDEMACPAIQIAGPAVHEEVRWDEWEDRVEEDRRTRPLSHAARAASTVDRGIVEDVEKHMNKYLAPAMPTIRPDKVKQGEVD